ncbi:MazG nucleotide pyrophosphohydrolase domain-containing protein [Lysobacter sp. A03]|uniref:MazG nucleotide pyrophosphohydrolase domain-containing protein n=1 Tax=Lysobacter sp. A03 TaxID=1199154 RepID=UPI00069807A5|nr:MazG nucleotide pyrophosphohydrolase domain-containing protein [Lysobacter sp. A03]
MSTVQQRGEAPDASALDGIATDLTAWERARMLQSRAAQRGFDWPDARAVVTKLYEEINEVLAEFDALQSDPDDPAAQDRIEDEIGDLLFVATNLARHASVDADQAMHRANAKFERRYRAMEVLARSRGKALERASLEQQEAYWAATKASEKGNQCDV